MIDNEFAMFFYLLPINKFLQIGQKNDTFVVTLPIEKLGNCWQVLVLNIEDVVMKKTFSFLSRDEIDSEGIIFSKF